MITGRHAIVSPRGRSEEAHAFPADVLHPSPLQHRPQALNCRLSCGAPHIAGVSHRVEVDTGHSDLAQRERVPGLRVPRERG
jgi:hypothetical protein